MRLATDLHGTILLLSWTIPPETTGSSVIVGNLAKQFTHRDMLVAGERPHGRPAVAWQEQWPKRHYVTRALPPSWRGARWWRWAQFPLLLTRVARLVRQYRCDTLVVVFPNDIYLLAGYLVARWTGARLFPYFHNTYLENRGGVGLRLARWLQPRVFRHARHLFVMSDGMAELYRERYPALECSPLLHSFNEAIPPFEPPPEPQTTLRLIISGSVNQSCRDAVVRVCRAFAPLDNVALTILSGTPRAQLARMDVPTDQIGYATVSRDEVLQRLSQADVVVLGHGFTGGWAPEEYRTIFPTRTIEYLISGRPILAHVPRDCYLHHFLQEHECALIVDEPDVAALRDAAESLRSDADLRARLVRNALRAAEAFQASRVANTLRVRLGVPSPASAPVTVQELTS